MKIIILNSQKIYAFNFLLDMLSIIMIPFLMMLGAFAIMSDAAFSMLSYRRHASVHMADQEMPLPTDLFVEIVFAMLLGVIGALLKFTGNLKPINLTEVLGQQTETYEQAMNQHRSYAQRNLQRSRAGAIFGSGACR